MVFIEQGLAMAIHGLVVAPGVMNKLVQQLDILDALCRVQAHFRQAMVAGDIQTGFIVTDPGNRGRKQFRIIGETCNPYQDGIVVDGGKLARVGQQLRQALGPGLLLQGAGQGVDQRVQGLRAGNTGQGPGLHGGIGIRFGQFDKHVLIIQFVNCIPADLWIIMLPLGAIERVKHRHRKNS